MYAVVDVGCPHSRDKKKDLMRQEVCGDEVEGPGIGECLEDSVNGVERQAGKWREGVLLVVGMVNMMQGPVAHI